MRHNSHILEIGDVEVEFAVDIAEIVEITDAVVVRLDIPPDADHLDREVYRRNVRCIESDGTTRWTIEEAEQFQGEYHPFTGLWEENGSVWAYNWNGVAYELDLEDGSHLDSKLVK